MRETVVIGGGLAGGASATLLALGGKRVTVLEREREPVDKVCGEFLSEAAQRSLETLGLDLNRLGASVITELQLAWGKRRIELPLPFVARGLSRRRLDEALLARAASAGAAVQRGVTVRSMAGGRLETSAGDGTPDTILLASGKHEIRGAQRDTSGCVTGYVGLKMHWRLPSSARNQLRHKINVTLFDGGYAGLQLIEDDVANLCLLIEKRQFADLGGNWRSLFQALIREDSLEPLLSDAEPLMAKPLTISAVPYGFLDQASDSSTLFRLGDQAAVIPSFCGEGMAIALRSATLAASIVGAGGCGLDLQKVLRDQVRRRIRLAMWLQRSGTEDYGRRMLWAAIGVSRPLASAIIRATRIAPQREDRRRSTRMKRSP